MSNAHITKTTIHKQLPDLVVRHIKPKGKHVPLLAFEVKFDGKTVYFGVANERVRPDGTEGLALSTVGQAVLETIAHFKAEATKPIVIQFKTGKGAKTVLNTTLRNADTGSMILCAVADEIISGRILALLDDNTALWAGEMIVDDIEYSDTVTTMFEMMAGHGVIAANAEGVIH